MEIGAYTRSLSLRKNASDTASVACANNKPINSQETNEGSGWTATKPSIPSSTSLKQNRRPWLMHCALTWKSKAWLKPPQQTQTSVIWHSHLYYYTTVSGRWQFFTVNRNEKSSGLLTDRLKSWLKIVNWEGWRSAKLPDWITLETNKIHMPCVIYTWKHDEVRVWVSSPKPCRQARQNSLESTW